MGPTRRITLCLFLDNGFDYVLCGEAEETLIQLCTSILQGESITGLDGLVRLDDGGHAVQSPIRLRQESGVG